MKPNAQVYSKSSTGTTGTVLVLRSLTSPSTPNEREVLKPNTVRGPAGLLESRVLQVVALGLFSSGEYVNARAALHISQLLLYVLHRPEEAASQSRAAEPERVSLAAPTSQRRGEELSVRPCQTILGRACA